MTCIFKRHFAESVTRFFTAKYLCCKVAKYLVDKIQLFSVTRRIKQKSELYCLTKQWAQPHNAFAPCGQIELKVKAFALI